MSVTSRLREAGVLPVVVIDDETQAVPLGHALLDAGVTAVEITLRTPAGLSAIARLKDLRGLTVGAGTVITEDDLRVVIDAGAEFIVSPGFDRHLVELAMASGILPVPGIATASEIMAAMRARLEVVKLFPAAQLGGPSLIAAFRGPFANIEFVPSGGIGLDNAADYVRDGVLSVSTSWIAPRALIASGDFAEITRRGELFLKTVRS